MLYVMRHIFPPCEIGCGTGWYSYLLHYPTLGALYSTALIV